MIFIGNSNRQARLRQDELMADAMMLSALNNANGGNVYNSSRMAGASVYGQQRPGNFYEQAIHMRHDMRRQREAYIEKQLEQNLPVCYLIIHCILLGCVGVVILALQAYAVANNIATNIAYTGFWCGPIFMILTVLTLVLFKIRTYRYYQILGICYSLSMLVGFVGLMVSITLRTSSTSADLSPTSFTYAIAALDAVASVLIIIYTICMSCCLIKDRRGRRSNTVISYHANQQARMNAMQSAGNGYPPSFSQLPPPPAYPAVVTTDSISFGSMQPPPPPQYSSNMNQGLYPSLG